MLKSSVLLATAVFVLCDSRIIEKGKRCMVKDEECQKSLFKKLVKTAPNVKSDPLIIKDYNIELLGLLNVTLLDGSVEGIKTCYSTAFKNDVEAGLAKIEIMCDHISIEGNYIGGLTPVLSALTGVNVYGKGSGSSVFEKLKVNVDIAFEVKKLDDHEVHFQLKREESSITFEVLGKLTVASKKFYVGEHDISKIVVSTINANWKSFINTFGQMFFDRVFNVIFKNFEEIFKVYPTKEFIADDLSYLVK